MNTYTVPQINRIRTKDEYTPTKQTYKQISSLLRKRAQHHKNNPTNAELATIEILKEMGVSFKFQSYNFHEGAWRIFDFRIRPFNIILEVDGGYHDPRKDAILDAIFVKSRPTYTVLRIKNEEALHCPENVKELLITEIRKKSAKSKHRTKIMNSLNIPTGD